eukprot:CAMPEP_0172440006 /NCGR_PEP_ID=MMETSP1065-20121228/811_1 /TAXON_ID=265537 /ORGANISM="Amphiprora paludosa, Strain CCMP125" /LENGTH=379 /DNA_ID=CAMNT_0013188783 /DNA_START=84 /DNA_END=1223 /DNA_ORIENTATION=-
MMLSFSTCFLLLSSPSLTWAFAPVVSTTRPASSLNALYGDYLLSLSGESTATSTATADASQGGTYILSQEPFWRTHAPFLFFFWFAFPMSLVETDTQICNIHHHPLSLLTLATGYQPQPIQYQPPQEDNLMKDDIDTLAHAPLSYFDISLLTAKGPRANADVGTPHDSSRKLAAQGMLSSGSWWCAAGGWPSPNPRATTEIFFVHSGHGCLTDLDGTRHFFGPGDTVILPKGWSGRWDVLQDIHKVWFVVDHVNIEEYGNPIRVLVTHYHELASQHLHHQGIRADALDDTKPSPASLTYYDVGPTKVGCWTCTSGSFPVKNPQTGFHVLEGVFLMHNDDDGSTQRVVAGDTVLLPRGWSGQWDVIEPVKKLWVVTKPEE